MNLLRGPRQVWRVLCASALVLPACRPPAGPVLRPTATWTDPSPQAWATAERARVRRELPGAQLLALHGANHYVFSSHPAEVTRAMRAFLSSRAGRPAARKT